MEWELEGGWRKSSSKSVSVGPIVPARPLGQQSLPLHRWGNRSESKEEDRPPPARESWASYLMNLGQDLRKILLGGQPLQGAVEESGKVKAKSPTACPRISSVLHLALSPDLNLISSSANRDLKCPCVCLNWTDGLLASQDWREDPRQGMSRQLLGPQHRL